MADRSVKIRLDANVEGFKAGMRSAVQAAEDFAKRADSAGGRALDWVGKHQQDINTVSNGFIGAGAVLTGFSAIAIKSASDFDQAMSSVEAATMAPAAEMEQLRAAAIEAGASTKYSATEAAAGIEELAKAGVSTADILNGGLAGALDLAASDNIAVAEAAEIASSAMTQFGLAGEDVTHIADLLAAGAGKAQGGVSDLGQALAQAGLVASNTGLTIEETVGGLTAFAAAGLMGSDAGTSFKSMLQALSNPSAKARREMDELGISMYDSQGEFIGLAGLAGQLETAMADLTPEQRNAAMAIIFGSDAVRAANILYSEGEAGIRDWIGAVDEQGFAAEQAAIRMDNLAGDIEELGGALETAFIGAGGGADSMLRPAVQTVTNLVNAFNDLPDSAKRALGNTTGVAGLSLLAVGGLGKAVTSAAELRGSLHALGIATDGLGRKFKLLGAATAAGLAITGLTIAIGNYFESIAEAQGRTDELADTLDELSGAATAATGETIISQLSDQLDEGDWDALEKIGLSQADLAAAVMEGGDAYDQAIAKLGEYALAQDGVVASGQNAEDAYQKAIDAMEEQNGALEEGRDKIQQTNEAQEQLAGSAEMSAEAQQTLTSAIDATGVGLEGVIEDMQTFLELLFATGLATMSARDAQAAYHESVSEVGTTVDELIEKHGGLGSALNQAKTDFDLTTEAGRTANGAFQDIARSGMDVVTSMSEAGASQDEIQGKLKGTYGDLISAAGQFGITGKAAEDLAREVLGVPDGVSIDTWMSDEAERQAESTKRAIDSIPRSVRTTVTTTYATVGTKPTFAGAQSTNQRGFAVGGPVHGPGTGTSDSIPARLSNGEHVLTAREVKAAGGHRAVAEIRASLLSGNRFADGGPVGGMVMPYEPRRQVASAAAGGTTIAPTFISNGLNAYESARANEAQMRHVLRDSVPTLPR